MRKFLLSAAAFAGIAVASQFAGAGAAQAQPPAPPQVTTAAYVAGGGGLIQPVQYNDWRWRRHEYWRWRRHEYWRHHGDYHHHW